MKKTTLMAVPLGTENLTAAWMKFAAAESLENLDRLGIELDRALRSRLPGGSCSWPIQGREDELRQDAAILLVQKFLLGNRRLMLATRKRQIGEVERELAHSLFHAVRIARKRLIHHAHAEAARVRSLALQDEGHCPHPTDRKFWSLPLALQRELALQALNIAVTGHLVPKPSAKLARDLITGSATQSELARKAGITRPAVHRRLEPVRQHLWDIIETLELSFV